MEFTFDNNIPIYIQLLEYLKIYLISGVFKCGDKLPSVRDFANTFKVNPNTMQKALLELESMKLIYTERTNGKYVTKDQKLIDKLKDEYAITLAKSYFQGMKRIGLGKADSIKYLEGIEE
jgi:DNA-binding transcriptional regulator YhcF (GntR family)